MFSPWSCSERLRVMVIGIGEEVVRMERVFDDLRAEALEEDGMVRKLHDIGTLTEMRDGIRNTVREKGAHGGGNRLRERGSST